MSCALVNREEMKKGMYFPIQLRLAIFYAVLLGIALLFFGNIVYMQAEQRAYKDLDTTLSSRAASVRLGKDLLADSHSLPFSLQSVDGLGTGGDAISVHEGKPKSIGR